MKSINELTKLVTIVPFLFFVTSASQCQSLEDGWKGLRVLKSSRADVEKSFDKNRDVEPFEIYEDEHAFVRVTYTLPPCTIDGFRRGKYNVPPDTVMEYEVRLKKLLTLSDLKFSRSRYERLQRGDVANLFEYVNKNDGITITVSVQEDKEYVNSIDFAPTAKLAEEFSCK